MIFSAKNSFSSIKIFQHYLINFYHEHFFLCDFPQEEEEAHYINFLDYSNDINALRKIPVTINVVPLKARFHLENSQARDLRSGSARNDTETHRDGYPHNPAIRIRASGICTASFTITTEAYETTARICILF